MSAYGERTSEADREERSPAGPDAVLVQRIVGVPRMRESTGARCGDASASWSADLSERCVRLL